MRQDKVFRLGKVVIDGDLIDFEPAEARDFEAARSDVVSLGVAYEYREVSEDKEHARIRLTAQLAGGKEESFEAHIGDNPALDDSRRGFLSVPIHVPGKGQLQGRFVIETQYESGPWTGKHRGTGARERVEGDFTLRVT